MKYEVRAFIPKGRFGIMKSKCFLFLLYEENWMFHLQILIGKADYKSIYGVYATKQKILKRKHPRASIRQFMCKKPTGKRIVFSIIYLVGKI